MFIHSFSLNSLELSNSLSGYYQTKLIQICIRDYKLRKIKASTYDQINRMHIHKGLWNDNNAKYVGITKLSL